MRTNFFQIIAHLKNTGSWTIHISPEGEDRLIVSVLLSDPKANKEGVMLSHMIFNNTPKVIDETLFDALISPVGQANELWENVSGFQKSMEDAKKLLDAKKAEEAKKASGTAPKVVKADDGAEKKQRYEDALKKIADFNGACKYQEGLDLLPEVSEYPDKKADLERLRKDLEIKKSQLSIL